MTAYQKWFGFYAHNSQAAYGYGTQIEADAYCDYLNRNRDVNHYYPEVITDAATLDGLNSGRDTDGFDIELELLHLKEETEK